MVATPDSMLIHIGAVVAPAAADDRYERVRKIELLADHDDRRVRRWVRGAATARLLYRRNPAGRACCG